MVLLSRARVKEVAWKRNHLPWRHNPHQHNVRAAAAAATRKAGTRPSSSLLPSRLIVRRSAISDESSSSSASTSTSTSTSSTEETKLYRCDDVVRHLWQNIDLTNSEKALEFFHEDVVYEDLIYSKPFVGKEEVKGFLQSSRDNAPEGLQFVLDDVSDGENACGFTWHLELEINGQTRNITKGISFYRLVSEVKFGFLSSARDYICLFFPWSMIILYCLPLARRALSCQELASYLLSARTLR